MEPESAGTVHQALEAIPLPLLECLANDVNQEVHVYKYMTIVYTMYMYMYMYMVPFALTLYWSCGEVKEVFPPMLRYARWR